MAWMRRLDTINIAIYMSERDLCSDTISGNSTVSCFIRGQMEENNYSHECEQLIDIDNCIKGNNCIICIQ